ncbi:DUF3169 family protein [Mammaliicoccus sp. Dog046]|uniref:DUF3169 family protein n=1 Tax=Mammaliicoccus sp. Dog046 TaxID=3034233 RepID=UPI002B25CF66|nr:DUF3169 family protein [Mammaliicoccus sp. Dog046]WQK84424.1 DUF3169 family protein [Mammaliicoccus sp. Dog046]
MKRNKIMFIGNFVLYLIIGGVCGGLLASLLDGTSNIFEFKLNKLQTVTTILILLGIYILFLLMLLSVYKKADNYRKVETTTQNEDEIEMKLERTLIYPPVLIGLIMTVGLIMLNIIINVSTDFSVIAYLITIIALIVTAPISFLHIKKLKKLYPERNYPHFTDKKLNEKLIDMMDSGEQYITLVALQKTYTLNQQLIVIMIAIASIFSMTSNNNQFFSVSLMIILYLINTMYYTKKVSETL